MFEVLKKYFNYGKNTNKNYNDEWIISKLKKLPEGTKILDAGAGEQRFKPFCSHLKYVSQDFAQYDGRGDNKGLQMQKWEYGKLDIISDITSIPEPDFSFDAIMCIEVFEHIPDPISTLKEFSRLIKKDGYLIITAPYASLTHFAPYHYYSGFNKYFYEKQLEINDFKIIEICPRGNFFEYLAQEIRRIPTIVKDYNGKQIKLWEYAALSWVIKILEKYGSLNNNSAEILNFGYMVYAQKIK